MNRSGKKALATQLYVQLGMSQKEIAEKVDVSAKTIGSWKDAENWDLLRAAEVTAPQEMVKQLYVNITKICKEADSENRKLTNAETDQIAKLMSSVNKATNKPTLAHYVGIMTEFALDVKATDLPLARIIVDKQWEFLKKKADEIK